MVLDLCKLIEKDIEQGNDMLVCGDFNEPLEEKKGIHKELNKLGLTNVLVGKIGSELPRTYNGGSKCIDHVYATPAVYDTIHRCGIAPFNYFQKSDHRGIYIDLKIEKILETETNIIPAANLRRLKTTSVGSLKLYQEAIIKEVTKNQYVKKVEELQAIIKNKTENEKMIRIRINELDEQITTSLISAEKKCAKIHMLCRHDWSPELKFALVNLRHAKRHLKKTLKETNVSEEDYVEKVRMAYEGRRKWRKACREAKENSKELRESFLEELAQHQALLNNTIASNEIKQLKRYEEQRKDAQRIRSVLKGRNHRLLTSIEIPDVSNYTGQESENDKFSHYDVDVIWNKLLKYNGADVKSWERIDDRKLVEELIVKWQQLYFGQSKNTPLAAKEWEERFKDDEFRNQILDGETIEEYKNQQIETVEFLRAMKRKVEVKKIPFIYTYYQFKNMIRKTKEKKTASPSGRHWGHYKALLEMEDDSMLKTIYKIMNMSMQTGIILERYTKVAITLLEKDLGRPRIHRLRPICIVEAELNCLAKQHWSRDLMWHVELNKSITNDQYGGRRGRQAQSAVINKILYYNIQHQIAEEAIFIDKDARSCFDRLIPQLVSLENEKLGSPKQAGDYMVKILDQQKLHFRTGYGITKSCVKKSKSSPKYGAGQGIGWSGQSCTATLNTIS